MGASTAKLGTLISLLRRGWATLLAVLPSPPARDGSATVSEYETAYLADIGGREEQQDRVAVFNGANAHLLVLADGVGGHEGGALAAQALIDVARDSFRAFESNSEDTPAQLLERIVLSAHERINALGREHDIKPHSTCVLLYLDSKAAAWTHVGDSRLYRFAKDRLVERTIDHSIVELMRLQGRITEAEMKTHQDKNRLFEALGGEQLPQAEAGSKEIAAGDGFLLASDGVWENVNDADLEAAIQADLATALRHLIESAKAHGGTECDNLSVAAVRT